MHKATFSAARRLALTRFSDAINSFNETSITDFFTAAERAGIVAKAAESLMELSKDTPAYEVYEKMVAHWYRIQAAFAKAESWKDLAQLSFDDADYLVRP